MINTLSNRGAEVSPQAALAPLSWQLDPQAHPFGPRVTELILAERQVPVKVTEDTSLRPKVLDACGMTCTFCHNEGTPVASDNKGKTAFFDIAGVSGRVSVFAASNGVDFVPGKMLPNGDFTQALSIMRDTLALDEMHMTGGEPTLHNQLPELVRIATDEGYKVKMTSNGENGASMIPRCPKNLRRYKIHVTKTRN